ncbi:heavy-metal-associated domain-containing protein [Leptospira idonii]|uniref:Copper chaperone n=1 Tax=Leptospira idonii TaxID=1193500 RepID=A0A4R9M2T2_9LEPT|nr:heavy-metal-associated domain-containing protein [Leptospira idonii]TGN19599.1 copper chaperone [Leptospira idonii]
MTSYKLDGMTCGHCVLTVQKIFANEGISAKADLSSQSVELEVPLDEEKWNRFRDLLSEEGYSLQK